MVAQRSFDVFGAHPNEPPHAHSHLPGAQQIAQAAVAAIVQPVIVQHAAAYLERIVVHMGMASDLFVQRIHLNHVLIVRIPDERCDHQAVECDTDLVKFLDFLKAYVGDARPATRRDLNQPLRSEEHTSELQSLMRTSYSAFCLTKQKTKRP